MVSGRKYWKSALRTLRSSSRTSRKVKSVNLESRSRTPLASATQASQLICSRSKNSQVSLTANFSNEIGSHQIYSHNAIAEKPTFELTHVKDIVVKSGQNYEIHVPFKAYPLPNAEWMIDDNDVPVDAERIQIKVRPTINFLFAG